MLSKKWIAVTMCLILLFSCSSLSAKPASGRSVPSNISAAPDSTRVLEARFLNMLNHNFAYNECFDSEADLVDAAALALYQMVDDDGFLAEAYVQDYLNDFYGVAVDDFSGFNPGFEKRAGYVYVVPRGFSVYSHAVRSITENEDGSYTVITDVIVSTHDGEKTNATATTLFVKSDASRFGYCIISSDISKKGFSI